MTPIYFPYTWITEPVLRALTTCFRRVVVYQPCRSHIPETLRDWEKKGRLEIRLPEAEDERMLAPLLRDYHAWADLHRGDRLDLEKFLPPSAPYFDEASTSRIRQEIRAAAGSADDTDPAKNQERSLLLRDRLFLILAQEYDQQDTALLTDLDRIERMEKALFRNLTPDGDDPLPMKPAAHPEGAVETGRPMLSERMAAWIRLHIRHQRTFGKAPEAGPIFITSDMPALDLLMTRSDGPEIICRVSDIPFGHRENTAGAASFIEDIFEKLQKTLGGPARPSDTEISFPQAGKPPGSTCTLTIYRVQGDAMARFVSGLKGFPRPSEFLQKTAVLKYMMVGCLEDKKTPL